MKKGGFWFLTFTFIFFLSQDYLFTDWQASAQLLGFPNWLWWYMGLHILFVLLFYQFIKRYWKE